MAPPGSVGSLPPYRPDPYSAPPAYGDGVGYVQHRGHAAQGRVHGDGVPYANHEGQPTPLQRPAYGDGVPYHDHRGYAAHHPSQAAAPPYADPRSYPQPPESHAPPHGAHRATHQVPPRTHPHASPAASAAPKTGEVHIQNRVTSPKEAQEKRTSWFLIGLTAFFLVWVFAAALFIFNQMNIL
ncbi:MAG: hypothetical protein AAF730_07570 [Bacteroidota bacterium]